MFECTFCGMAICSKSWKWHEETQHLPQNIWTCMPEGPLIQVSTSDGQAELFICAFCGVDAVNGACPHDHRATECLKRPIFQREFHRKEHLAQHIKNCHPNSELTPLVSERWHRRREYENENWTCGFCQKLLENWNVRASHIAQHFRDGQTMASWSLKSSAETQDNAPWEPGRQLIS